MKTKGPESFSYVNNPEESHYSVYDNHSSEICFEPVGLKYPSWLCCRQILLIDFFVITLDIPLHRLYNLEKHPQNNQKCG